MKTLIARLAIAIVLLPAVGFSAEPAAPLGFELGKASLDSVCASAGVEWPQQISNITKGPFLRLDGEKFSLPGLKDVILQFDTDQKLQAVLMTLPKGGMGSQGFDKYFKYLDSAYDLVDSKRAFVGNQKASFRASNAVIELTAPHLSFDLTVLYMTAKFEQALENYQHRKEANKRAAESAAF